MGMLGVGMTWYELALSLNNPLDFNSFVALAEDKGVAHRFSKRDYCCRVGTLLGEKVNNLNLSIDELYNIAFPTVIGSVPQDIVSSTPTCCGGGAVR